MPTKKENAGATLSGKGLTLWKERGLTEETAKHFGIKSANKYFAKIGGEAEAIGFPYSAGTKFRAIDVKTYTITGQLDELFGIDLLPGDMTDQDLLITEGEWDAPSAYQAGFLNATSVPHGAPNQISSRTPDNDDPRFRALWSAHDRIEKTKRILIWTDTDESGDALAEEIARRIGKGKCWRVRAVEGCKDANDVLRLHGAQAVMDCIAQAEPWPVAGLYEAESYFDRIDKLYDRGLDDKVATGFDCLDPLYSPEPGMVTIVTGFPGSGKSEFIDELMVRLAQRYDWRHAVCSFENPPELHIVKLTQKRLGKLFFHDDFGTRMTTAELAAGRKWVADHFIYLEQKDGVLPALGSILDRLKAAVLRKGIRGAVIDPYNFVMREKNQSETDWVSEMLTQVKMFAAAHGVHVWFIAHPRTIYRSSDGSTPVPRGSEISGCHSDDTLVCTRRGFIPHSEIAPTDEVLCLDLPRQRYEWHRPTMVHCYDYKGDMIHFSGGRSDLLVTPNHRMVTLDDDDECVLVEATEVKFGEMPALLPVASDELPLPFGIEHMHVAIDFARALAAVLEYGYYNPIPNGEEIRMFGAPEYMARICYAINAVGDFYAFIRDHSDILDQVVIGSRFQAQRDFLRDLLVCDSWPPELRDCHPIVMREILLSRSPRLVVKPEQRLRYLWAATIAGLDVVYAKDAMMFVPANGLMCWRAGKVLYDGKVWCLTVPTGAYVTARNGYIAVSGNSAAWWAKADFGITIHRTSPDDVLTQVHVWKVRFNWLGKAGMASLVYDETTSVLREADPFDLSNGPEELDNTPF